MDDARDDARTTSASRTDETRARETGSPASPTATPESVITGAATNGAGADTAPTRGRRVPRWAFLPFILVSIVHAAALALHSDVVAAPTKLLLIPALAFAVLVGARGLRSTAAVTLLLIAILFSWLGDGAGTFVPFWPTLEMMLVFFGIAHLAYIALFWRHVSIRRFPWWSLLLIAWWAGMLIVIGPHAGGLVIALGGYGLVLGGTAALATRCAPAVVIGGLFFLASDTILAFRLFMSELMPDWTSPLVMATYCLGQGLIAAGVLATLRRRQRATLPHSTTASDV